MPPIGYMYCIQLIDNNIIVNQNTLELVHLHRIDLSVLS
jgi:hypothetical protein